MLLQGGVIEGQGDFTYCAQPLLLLGETDPNTLPGRPAFGTIPVEPNPYVSSLLQGVQFRDGFTPISASGFAVVAAAHDAWVQGNNRAMRWLLGQEGAVWQSAAAFPMHTLTSLGGYPMWEECDEEVAALRTAFPELAAMTDAALHGRFSDFDLDCHVRPQGIQRDVEFLYYLLGLLASDRATVDRDAVPAGRAAALCFLRLQPGDISAALAFGRACAHYDHAITAMAWRYNQAMAFLRHDASARASEGAPVTTFLDTIRADMRLGAKFNRA